MRDTSHYLEVITGPMFSGKTTELLRQYEVFRKCGFPVQVFKWAKDDVYGKDVVTHSGLKFSPEDVFAVGDSSEMRGLVRESTKVVLVDGAHFFDWGLTELLDELANSGKMVVVTTLSADYMGKPFGISPYLLARADYVTSLNARCMFSENGKLCLRPATKSARVVEAKQQILVGGHDSYQPRCRMHHKS